VIETIRWDRTKIIQDYKRKTRHKVFEQVIINPIFDFNKWDEVSAKILNIGDYYDCWNWLIDHYYDADTVITGRKGSGKTSVTLRIGYDKSKQKDVSFTVKKNVLLGRKVDLTPELISDDFEEYQVIAIEELQHAFHKMRSTTTANVEANRFMDLKRKFKLNVIGNMPKITSVDKDLVNEKIVFWINCWKNSKRKKEVHTIIHVNVQSRDGKYSDFIKLEERIFPYAPKALYEKATKKWGQKMTDVRELEDFRKAQLRRIELKQQQQKRKRVQEIVHSSLTDNEKGYLLLDMGYSKGRIPHALNIKKRAKFFCEEREAELDVNPLLIEDAKEKLLLELEQKGERE